MNFSPHFMQKMQPWSCLEQSDFQKKGNYNFLCSHSSWQCSSKNISLMLRLTWEQSHSYSKASRITFLDAHHVIQQTSGFWHSSLHVWHSPRPTEQLGISVCLSRGHMKGPVIATNLSGCWKSSHLGPKNTGRVLGDRFVGRIKRCVPQRAQPHLIFY